MNRSCTFEIEVDFTYFIEWINSFKNQFTNSQIQLIQGQLQLASYFEWNKSVIFLASSFGVRLRFFFLWIFAWSLRNWGKMCIFMWFCLVLVYRGGGRRFWRRRRWKRARQGGPEREGCTFFFLVEKECFQVLLGRRGGEEGVHRSGRAIVSIVAITHAWTCITAFAVKTSLCFIIY